MRYLIDQMVINADHIVQVSYTPARIGFDEDDNAPYDYPSECEIKLTSVHLEMHYQYDGGIDAYSSQSDTVTLCGKWADRFWGLYASDAETA